MMIPIVSQDYGSGSFSYLFVAGITVEKTNKYSNTKLCNIDKINKCSKKKNLCRFIGLNM